MPRTPSLIDQRTAILMRSIPILANYNRLFPESDANAVAATNDWYEQVKASARDLTLENVEALGKGLDELENAVIRQEQGVQVSLPTRSLPGQDLKREYGPNRFPMHKKLWGTRLKTLTNAIERYDETHKGNAAATEIVGDRIGVLASSVHELTKTLIQLTPDQSDAQNLFGLDLADAEQMTQDLLGTSFFRAPNGSTQLPARLQPRLSF